VGRDPATLREILHLLNRRFVTDREHDLDGFGRRLRITQLTEADNIGTRLLHPVTAGYSEVEQTLCHVGRDLLGPQDVNLVDARVVDLGPVVHLGGPADCQVGRGEQFEGRMLQRAFGENQT
jgi:hypothetical protein